VIERCMDLVYGNVDGSDAMFYFRHGKHQEKSIMQQGVSM